jgi:hypothetical protein
MVAAGVPYKLEVRPKSRGFQHPMRVPTDGNHLAARKGMVRIEVKNILVLRNSTMIDRRLTVVLTAGLHFLDLE